jgi:hypothetical protein
MSYVMAQRQLQEMDKAVRTPRAQSGFSAFCSLVMVSNDDPRSSAVFLYDRFSISLLFARLSQPRDSESPFVLLTLDFIRVMGRSTATTVTVDNVIFLLLYFVCFPSPLPILCHRTPRAAPK